ncbi:hypothetical protein AUK10_01635 [Candidatus Gracilibacteria bacterium CG2_30_37_12]|nr:MAG: hypothetical protein AUK10_01635 [Candidatus Gracilibacteria bacterium CG2_30_37_12]
MKKLPILHIILIVLLVGVIAFGFFANQKKTNTIDKNLIQTGTITNTGISETNSLYEAEQKQLQEKMDSYTTYNTAVDTLDITLCEKIINNDTLKKKCTDNVYSAQAAKNKDATLCEKIQDTKTKAHCANNFIYEAITSSGNIADCSKITGDDALKNTCTKNIVFAQIESTSFSGTTNTCDSLTGADKDYCINRIKKNTDVELLQKGTNTKDINICKQIADLSMKNTCSDTIYMTLALEQKNASLCTKIVDTARKTNCTTQFVRINDVNILQKALAENNLSLCSTITTPDLKIKCNDSILLKQGVANKDNTLCLKIHDIGTQKQCSDAVKLRLEQTK